MQFTIISSSIILFIIFFIIGQTIMPKSMSNGNDAWFNFLISPLLGLAAWIAVSIFAGTLFGYNLPILCILTLPILILIAWRRKYISLEFPKTDLLYLLPILLIAYFVALAIIPREIDGGLYFGTAIYDHVKSALVDSIAANGLPPQSPFLSDGGIPVLIYYYYGWHAFAAQLVMFTSMSGYDADVTLTFFTALVNLCAIAAFTYKFSGKKWSAIFVFLFALFSLDSTAIVPESLNSFVFPKIFVGFWGWHNNSLWVPQHMLSGTIVILVLYLFSFLLNSAKKDWYISCMIGLLSAASFFCSIYAGTFTLIVFLLSLLPFYIFDKVLRTKLNAKMPLLIFSALVGVCISFVFIKYLYDNPPEKSPLEFGILPSYQTAGALAWLHFYLVYLPCRLGITYVIAIYILFKSDFFSVENRLFANFLKILFAGTFAVIFFIHSTFYSNDFGWRVVSAAQDVILILSSAFIVKLILDLRRKKSILACAWLSFIAIYFVAIAPHCIRDIFYIQRDEPELHQTFARAKDGWIEVQKLTSKSDMVISNPVGFKNINGLYKVHFTNVFFSLYARRPTPISDLIFAKCYSEFYELQKLEDKYTRVCKFFEGDASKEQLNYIAHDLKVKAILVTPYDGLWLAHESLTQSYDLAREEQFYKIYLLKAEK